MNGALAPSSPNARGDVWVARLTGQCRANQISDWFGISIF